VPAAATPLSTLTRLLSRVSVDVALSIIGRQAEALIRTGRCVGKPSPHGHGITLSFWDGRGSLEIFRRDRDGRVVAREGPVTDGGHSASAPGAATSSSASAAAAATPEAMEIEGGDGAERVLVLDKLELPALLAWAQSRVARRMLEGLNLPYGCLEESSAAGDAAVAGRWDVGVAGVKLAVVARTGRVGAEHAEGCGWDAPEVATELAEALNGEAPAPALVAGAPLKEALLAGALRKHLISYAAGRGVYPPAGGSRALLPPGGGGGGRGGGGSAGGREGGASEPPPIFSPGAFLLSLAHADASCYIALAITPAVTVSQSALDLKLVRAAPSLPYVRARAEAGAALAGPSSISRAGKRKRDEIEEDDVTEELRTWEAALSEGLARATRHARAEALVTPLRSCGARYVVFVPPSADAGSGAATGQKKNVSSRVRFFADGAAGARAESMGEAPPLTPWVELEWAEEEEAEDAMEEDDESKATALVRAPAALVLTLGGGDVGTWWNDTLAEADPGATEPSVAFVEEGRLQLTYAWSVFQTRAPKRVLSDVSRMLRLRECAQRLKAAVDASNDSSSSLKIGRLAPFGVELLFQGKEDRTFGGVKLNIGWCTTKGSRPTVSVSGGGEADWFPKAACRAAERLLARSQEPALLEALAAAVPVYQALLSVSSSASQEAAVATKRSIVPVALDRVLFLARTGEPLATIRIHPGTNPELQLNLEPVSSHNAFFAKVLEKHGRRESLLKLVPAEGAGPPRLSVAHALLVQVLFVISTVYAGGGDSMVSST